MKAIVVGAGGTSRELMRRLGERWTFVVVDPDEEHLTAISAIRDVETMQGDGSSRLTLERAGLKEAEALIAATDDDDVNLEAARHAREAGLLRIAAVAADPERLPDYRAEDISVYSPDSLAARSIEVVLEPRRVASTAFADGKAEAMEFRITPDSPVRGKRLRDLHSETWIVAAILREGRLVVPHGATRLEAGDRVTIVGAAADFSRVVRTFTSGESRFPLGFGRNVAVGVSGLDDAEGPAREAMSFVRNSQAEALILVHRDPLQIRDESEAEEVREAVKVIEERAEGIEVLVRVVDEPLPTALRKVASAESVGVVVVPGPKRSEIVGRLQVSRLVRTYSDIGVPILVSRGSHPYSAILAPARRTRAGEAAARAAIDLSHTAGASLEGVAVVPPPFVVSENEIDEARQAVAWLREEAAVQGVSVRRKLRRGNPVRVMAELASVASLVVLAMPDSAEFFRPGITGHLLRRLDASMLLVPVSE
ncbi:MAG: hypothetical protein HKN07_13025 [Acidimicrobiia bacterium]|nr:hypothetical protein [Acidimicrobiia bacterium]